MSLVRPIGDADSRQKSLRLAVGSPFQDYQFLVLGLVYSVMNRMAIQVLALLPCSEHAEIATTLAKTSVTKKENETGLKANICLYKYGVIYLLTGKSTPSISFDKSIFGPKLSP